MTLLETISWAQDPIAECAGQPVIPAANFDTLADNIIAYDEVKLTKQEILDIFSEQVKRFAACGANHSEQHGVLRKNPKTGWKYIEDLVLEN